jgi:ABC-2 type transport system permease protein
MQRIWDIAVKDLLQNTRSRMTFLFFLVMPLLFTLLFGYANGSFASAKDSRLPVGFLDEDKSQVSLRLRQMFEHSQVIRLETFISHDQADYEQLVMDGQLAAAVIIPEGYGHTSMHGKRARMTLIADTSTTSGTSIKSDLLAAAVRLENAVRTALIFDDADREQTPFRYILDEAIKRWEDPPIIVKETSSSLLLEQNARNNAMVHLSPAMMLQFAVAGLMTAAQIIVSERKARALQRMLTMDVEKTHILCGHFLAIYTLIMFEFFALITFGQFVLGINYLHVPEATLLVAAAAAACFAALGLLIGMIARTEDQAVIFSLVPMFVFSGLGGAWVPLEATSETFQLIGHFTPVAWAIDGFKNIIIRGWGVESVLTSVVVLLGYAVLFFGLAAWRFRVE